MSWLLANLLQVPMAANYSNGYGFSLTITIFYLSNVEIVLVTILG